MTKILCRVALCPFIGHVSESQFASGVCGRCGKYFGCRRRGNALAGLLFWGVGAITVYLLTTLFVHLGWYR